MNENQNQNNRGEQIRDALAEALQSGNFGILNDLVTQTVTDTLNEVGKHIADAVPPEDISQWKQKAGERKRQEENRRERQEEIHRRQREERRRQEESRREEERRQQEMRRREEERRQQEAFRRQEELRRKEERRQQEQFRQRERRRQQEQSARQQSSGAVSAVRSNVGSVSGILFQVFGGIGFGILGLAMLGRLLLFLIGISGTPASFGVHLALLAGFAGMIGTGIGRRKRMKRADRYITLCGGRMYGDIEKLAEDTGKSERYVRRDIRRMLKAGMFPEGHLDRQETCFMLNDAVYRQYQEAEENRRIREEEEKKAAVSGCVSAGEEKKAAAFYRVQTEDRPEDKPAENSPENELNAMVSEGMECIRRLRELNDNIEGEAISGKLSRLEDLLKEIFDSVREHPEQMHRMHKPMDYYLPTTLKLVEAYEEFDKISVPGEEVLQAKTEIEKTLDIINEAFAELLNNLFQDAVFDATTDAQVLKSMLAREGLTKELELT